VAVALALWPGCRRAPEPPPEKKERFHLGFIAEGDVFEERHRMEILARYLSSRLGVSFDTKVLYRYGNILETIRRLDIEAAFLGSFTACLAMEQLGMEPVARPVWLNGRSTYRGLILVRRDSGIRRVEQLMGSKIAFVDRAATAGFLFPLSLAARYVRGDPSGFFGAILFVGDQEAVAEAVASGEVDAGAIADQAFERVARSHPEVADRLTVVVSSDHVPDHTLLCSPRLPQEFRERLRKVLVSMERDEEGIRVLQAFGARRFVLTTRTDFDAVYRYAREAKIDLRRYRYRNE
jgi:phosphonate transport system substrate-binding protein